MIGSIIRKPRFDRKPQPPVDLPQTVGQNSFCILASCGVYGFCLVPPFSIRRTHPITNYVDCPTLCFSGEHISFLKTAASHVRPPYPCDSPFPFSLFQRALAACCASLVLCSAVIFFIRARPPLRPSATAAGFLRFMLSFICQAVSICQQFCVHLVRSVTHSWTCARSNLTYFPSL